jgi:hypothetical protein
MTAGHDQQGGCMKIKLIQRQIGLHGEPAHRQHRGGRETHGLHLPVAGTAYLAQGQCGLPISKTLENKKINRIAHVVPLRDGGSCCASPAANVLSAACALAPLL